MSVCLTPSACEIILFTIYKHLTNPYIPSNDIIRSNKHLLNNIEFVSTSTSNESNKNRNSFQICFFPVDEKKDEGNFFLQITEKQ